AERDHIEPRPALEPVKLANQAVRLVDGLGTGQRHAGEMKETAVKPAAHHPVRGYRRIDATGHQHEAAPAHSDRQAALASQAIGVHEDLGLVDLDVDREIRMPQIDRVAELPLDPAADRDRQLGRRHRETLVAPLGPDREAAWPAPGQVSRYIY